MEPRWVTGIVTTVKGMLANRARLKAEQERAAILEKMDVEMRRQRYYNPGIQCQISGAMEYCDHPSTITTQRGSPEYSTGNVTSQAIDECIVKVEDSGVLISSTQQLWCPRSTCTQDQS